MEPTISVEHLVCTFNFIQVPYAFISSGNQSFVGLPTDAIMLSAKTAFPIGWRDHPGHVPHVR